MTRPDQTRLEKTREGFNLADLILELAFLFLTVLDFVPAAVATGGFASAFQARWNAALPLLAHGG